MSDPLTSLPFGGNPGDPVAEVDPDDLKTFWQETRHLCAQHPGQSVSMTSEHIKTLCKSEANPEAVWYRSTMLWVLNQFAQDQLAPWVNNEEFADAVFRTMATIPMEWIGHTDREGLPFDLEEFFRRLGDSSVPTG